MGLPRLYLFPELQEAKIVRDRSHLHRLQKDHDFPRTVALDDYIGARAYFLADEVDAWIDAHLKPKGEVKLVPRPGSRPRGRPRKQIVTNTPDLPVQRDLATTGGVERKSAHAPVAQRALEGN